MKTLKNITIAFIFSILCIVGVKAQEYKMPVRTSGKILVTKLYGKILIEGHSGNELIITVSGLKSSPARADGLRSLYGTRDDNTGIGLSVEEVDDVIEITAASKQAEDARYKFLVPQNVSISIDCNSPFADEDIFIKDLASEIEVKILNGGIEFENITGPAVLYAINGDIIGTFSEVNQENPISITSINGDVDITLPANTPANLKLSSTNGEIFTNMDIEFDSEKTTRRRTVRGKLNGGGVEIQLAAINENVYLRKK